MSSGFFITLENRGLVRVTGPDRRAFLQGLITNDVALLDSQPCVYACLLTPQGKFLHDFFMTEQGDSIDLECEGGPRARDLAARLAPFRLRSKVTIESVEKIDVYAVYDDSSGVPDPRHPALGRRSHEKPALPERPFADWDRLRINLTIPDGSRDLAPGTSTLEDARLDTLNAVSYTKGCYMGQELTARIHHRGLAKRHLYTIQSPALPPPDTEIRIDNTLLGEMRSSCGDLGLALLKDNSLASLPEAGLKIMETGILRK